MVNTMSGYGVESAAAGPPLQSIRVRVVVGLLGVAMAMGGAACAAYVLALSLTGREMSLGVVFSTMMSTRWGWWMGAPVTAWLLAMFVFVLAAAWRSRRRGRAPRHLEELVAAEVALGGTALWFMVLIINGDIHASRWFFMILACAILSVHFLLYHTPVVWRGDGVGGGADRRLTRRGFFNGAVVGATGVGVLILGQWLGPLPARAGELTRLSFARMHLDSGADSDRRVIWPYDAVAPVQVEEYPLIGWARGPCIVVSSLDYSDAESRLMHAHLLRLRETYGKHVAILPLWFPLDPACNPQAVAPTGTDHPNACEYARLSLAVWLAAPDHFEAFHAYLLHRDDPAAPIPLADAEREATRLVGKEALRRALASPRITELLATAIAAKPPHPEFGDTDEERARHQLRPITMWASDNAESPGMIISGVKDFQELARVFERSTGMFPLERPETGHTDLLEKLAR